MCMILHCRSWYCRHCILALCHLSEKLDEKICPKHQFTTLDTHDGIGVMDTYHLIPDDEIDRTLERLSCI